jgi:hypothetical protein
MRLFLAAFALMAVCVAGCSGTGGPMPSDQGVLPSDELELASVLRFSDVPAPRGFALVEGKSWTYEAKGGVRLAELHYIGKASLQRVVSFFEEQMPISGWQKEMSVGPETKKRLHFKHSRKSERCKVVISTMRGGYTHVVIEVD